MYVDVDIKLILEEAHRVHIYGIIVVSTHTRLALHVGCI